MNENEVSRNPILGERAQPLVAAGLLIYVVLTLPGWPVAVVGSAVLFVYAWRLSPPTRARRATLVQSALAALIVPAVVVLIA